MIEMLLCLGDVVFKILPIGLDEIDHAATASFAAHPVLGDMPSLEFTGKGPETWRIRGTLMPEFSAGVGAGDGQDDLNALHAMREAGLPIAMMRGDGVWGGMVAITRVAERSRRLNAKGVGRIIEVEIDVVRTPKPGPANYLLPLIPA
jgi:hypothetical protein